MKDIVILGGGITGSALAYYLSKKNFKVKLFEQGSCLGGLSRSVWVDKWKCWNDIGPHIFHSPDEEITNLWQELFSEIFQEGDYFSAVVKGKEFEKFYSYPISAEGIKASLNKPLDISNNEQISLKDQAYATNFRDLMQAKLGNELEKMFFRDYPEKLWGIPTNEMRSEWAPKRIKIREKIDTFFSGQFVATSKKGAGHAYRIIYDVSKDLGCEFLFGKKITNLFLQDSKILKIEINNNEIIDTSNSIVISTLPLTITAKFLNINISLDYRGVKISNWIVSKRNLLPNNYGWIYFDDFDIPFTRITDFTKMSPDSMPSTKGIISVECPFSPNESNLESDSQTHQENVRYWLDQIPWIKGNIVDLCSFFSEPYVYPIREKGYEDQINIFNSFIGQIENLWSIGAAGGFEYSDAQILFRKAKDFTDDLYSDFNKGTNRLMSLSIKNNLINDLTFDRIDSDVVVISEIGINHNGSIDLALKLIQESKNCGADFVKFQLYEPEKRSASNIRDAFYSERADGEGESLNDLFQSCHLNINDLIVLKNYADKLGIGMFLSAFDGKSVLEATKLQNQYIKISSMDLTNIEVWEAATMSFEKIISSTGMSTLDEVNRSYKYACERMKKPDITLLHCVSSYPMPLSDAKLGRIKLLQKICPKVGYSDHSTSIEIPYTAALMGATVIEKHFTLDKNLKGPDHVHSATPNELKRMIELIKLRSKITTTPEYEISKIQTPVLMKQKKGYFYNSSFKKGHILSREDMNLSTPCLGSDTFECYELLGKTLIKDVKLGEPVSKDIFID